MGQKAFAQRVPTATFNNEADVLRQLRYMISPPQEIN
jgi:hypothetical protein